MHTNGTLHLLSVVWSLELHRQIQEIKDWRKVKNVKNCALWISVCSLALFGETPQKNRPKRKEKKKHWQKH
jgi:hypothetical protein